MTFITSVQRDRFMRYDDVFSNSASGTTEQNIISQRISRLDPPFKSLSLLPNLDVSATSQHPIYHWCHTFNGIVSHKKRRHCATYSGGQLIELNLEGSHMHARPKKDKGTTQHSRSIRKTATTNLLQSPRSCSLHDLEDTARHPPRRTLSGGCSHHLVSTWYQQTPRRRDKPFLLGRGRIVPERHLRMQRLF